MPAAPRLFSASTRSRPLRWPTNPTRGELVHCVGNFSTEGCAETSLGAAGMSACATKSGPGSIDQPAAEGKADQLAGAVEIELFHDAASVGFHRVHAQV